MASKGRKRVEDKTLNVYTPLRKSQIAKLETYLPQDLRSKVIRNTVDLLLQALEEYDNEFFFDIITAKHKDKYKIIKVEQV